MEEKSIKQQQLLSNSMAITLLATTAKHWRLLSVFSTRAQPFPSAFSDRVCFLDTRAVFEHRGFAPPASTMVVLGLLLRVRVRAPRPHSHLLTRARPSATSHG